MIQIISKKNECTDFIKKITVIFKKADYILIRDAQNKDLRMRFKFHCHKSNYILLILKILEI